MGKTKDSGSEPAPQPNNVSTDWKEVEYKECSEDWRNRDRLIWATLPVAATVAAVIVGAAYGQIHDDKLYARFCVLLIGVLLTATMLISLIRHRMYQQGSEEQIRWLQEKLSIADWDRRPRIHHPRRFTLWNIIPTKKTDAILTTWARQEIGYMWDIKPSNKVDALLTRWAKRGSGFKYILRSTLVITAVLVILAIFTLVQWILN